MKSKLILILLFCIAVLLLSCEKDVYESPIYQEQPKNINLKTISLDQLKFSFHNLVNNQEIDKLNIKSKNDLLLGKNASQNDVTVLSDEIREINKNSYTSYTMVLATSDTVATNFYNLTLEVENLLLTGAFVTKYIASESWMSDKSQPFDGSVYTYKFPGEINSIENINTKLTQAFDSNPDTSSGGIFNLSGGGASSVYPTDCNGIVTTTILVNEIKCGCGHTWQDYLIQECTGCTSSSPAFPSLSTSIVYECIPYFGNPTSGNPTDNNGNGNSSGLGSGTTNPSITSPILLSPPDCLPSPGDMNMDCIIDVDEVEYINYINSISIAQKQALKKSLSVKSKLFYFLVDNMFAEEAQDYAQELLEYIALNNNSPEAIEEIEHILDLLDDGKINGEDVLVGPDVTITNMTQYLSIFNTSQPAEISIYADQPKTGTHNLTSSTERVGHTFISIKQGTKTRSFGFYPESSLGALIPNFITPDPNDFFSTSGAFGNDEGHNFDVSLTTSITSTQLSNTITAIITLFQSEPYYNLASANCTDLGIQIFENAANLAIPSCESPRIYFDGQSPGTLGEVIRTIQLPPNSSKNTTRGTAPQNSTH